MLFTQAAKLESPFCSGDYRPFVAAIEDHSANTAKNLEQMFFVCLVNDEKYEEIMTYNQILDHIEQSEEDAIV
jgi:hypothetical protein